MQALLRRSVRPLPLVRHRVVSTQPTPPPPAPPPSIPHYLGYAGALPFLAGGMFATHPSIPLATQLYGSCILSFLGGVHWGVALQTPRRLDFFYSVTPSLVAWTAALLPTDTGLYVLAGGFSGAFIVDAIRFAKDVPPWYRKLRVPLSVAAIGGCVLAARGVPRDEGVCLREGDAVVISTSPMEPGGKA